MKCICELVLLGPIPVPSQTRMTDLPTQNPYPFIYLKRQKGTFQEEHSCTCHSREYPHLPWGMTIVFLFCSKGMSLVYSFSGVALWFCVCGSSLGQSGTNQEEFSVYLLAEYHIDCLQLPRLSQSPSLSLSLSRSLLPQKTLKKIYRSRFGLVKTLELEL